MSAPAPGPAPTNPVNTPSFQIQQQPALANGFRLEADGSATRTFRSGNKNLKITVYFPQNCTDAQRNSRLQNFTEANLGLLGAEAVKLGLGTQGKGTKGTVNAIGFKQNDAGQLVEASKYFSNLRQPKVITSNYYDQKIASSQADQVKKRKLEAKKQTFIGVQNVWTQIRVSGGAAPARPNPAPPPPPRPPTTNPAPAPQPSNPPPAPTETNPSEAPPTTNPFTPNPNPTPPGKPTSSLVDSHENLFD